MRSPKWLASRVTSKVCAHLIFTHPTRAVMSELEKSTTGQASVPQTFKT
jgi:hypothetical protein